VSAPHGETERVVGSRLYLKAVQTFLGRQLDVFLPRVSCGVANLRGGSIMNYTTVESNLGFSARRGAFERLDCTVGNGSTSTPADSVNIHGQCGVRCCTAAVSSRNGVAPPQDAWAPGCGCPARKTCHKTPARLHPGSSIDDLPCSSIATSSPQPRCCCS
jgi:hypothetical protein